jgi:hypothetical protein
MAKSVRAAMMTPEVRTVSHGHHRPAYWMVKTHLAPKKR